MNTCACLYSMIFKCVIFMGLDVALEEFKSSLQGRIMYE